MLCSKSLKAENKETKIACFDSKCVQKLFLCRLIWSHLLEFSIVWYRNLIIGIVGVMQIKTSFENADMIKLESHHLRLAWQSFIVDERYREVSTWSVWSDIDISLFTLLKFSFFLSFLNKSPKSGPLQLGSTRP